MSDDFNRDDLPDWLRGSLPEGSDDEPETDAPLDQDEEDEGEAPDWLTRLGGLTPTRPEPSTADEDAQAAADLPNWLFDADDDLPAEPEASGEVPSWLADLAAPSAQPTPQATEPSLGEMPSDDFLSMGDSLPATSDLEMTYQQWRAQQERERSGPDLEAETPDLFAGMDDAGASARSTGELPDWYLGLEEMDEAEVPDWMAEDSKPSTASLPSALDDETPAWLQGMEEPNAAPPPATGDFDDDFFAALGLPPPEPAAPANETVDLSWLNDETLTTASDRTRDDAREEDFFEALANQPVADLPPLEPLEEELDDALSTIDDQMAAALMASAPDEDDLSWLRETMPAEAETETAPATGDLEDLFAGFEAEAPEEAPAAKLPGTSEFAIDWGEEEAPDFDTLTASTPQPAGSLDDLEFPLDEEDPFLNFDAPQPRRADLNAEPDWLGDLDAESLLDAEALPPDEGPSLLEAERPTLPTTAELDLFLAGLSDDPSRLPQTGQLSDQVDFDFDKPFGQEELDRMAPEPRSPVEPSGLAEATPDFLRDLAVSVGEISAGAIVRQRKDRPLDALPDRLKDLHERGEKLRPASVMTSDEDLLKRVLPGVPETLAPAPISTGLPSIPEALALSESERERVNLLQSLVRRETGMTADRPAEEAAAVPNGKRKKATKAAKTRRPTGKRRRRYPIDRLVIAAALAASVVAPFYLDDLRLGSLPPASFSTGTPSEAAFTRVDALQPGDLVLVAVEYGPTGAGELDPMLDALVRHMLMVGAHPVLVGGHPVGLTHAANVVEAIGRDAAFMERAGRRTPLQANRDYTVVRYLAGDLVGLRALTENAAAFMLTDIRGQATNLRVRSLNDFEIIVVVTDDGDDVRNYAEQVAPVVTAPLMLATSYSAGPLARPYAATPALQGLLVGYGDAYTYAAMIGEPVLTDASAPQAPVEAGDGAVVAPEETGTGPEISLLARLATLQARYFAPAAEGTKEATEAATEPDTEATTPAATPTEEPTEAATATTRATVTQAAGAPVQATETQAPTATNTLTPTPTNTATATATATATVTPSPTPTATNTATRTPTTTATPNRTPTRAPSPAAAEAVIGRVVSSNDSVNVRSGPGTNFSVVGAVPSRTDVAVIGVNENRTWYLVRLPDSDEEGWIAAQLVYIADGADQIPTVAGEGAFKLQPLLRPLAQATDEPTPDATAEATERATERATARPTATQAALAAVEPATAPPDYRDERWYATTLGIIASSTIIALGAAVNIARGIGRRRSR